MLKTNWLILLLITFLALAIAGGVRVYQKRTADSVDRAQQVTAAASPVLQGLTATVYKTQSCGCCKGYVEFLEKHGVTVEAIDTIKLVQIKMDRGVPAPAMNCHTTLIDGYVVEGHVPLRALEQLLTERPDIDGVALPGMPVGTPGMPGQKKAAFDVFALDDGGFEPYASF